MLKKGCKGKIDKTVEKVVETGRNQDNGDSNMACTRLKFVSFPSTLNKVNFSNLKPRWRC